MKQYLIMHRGTSSECIIASSLNKALCKEADLTWVVSDPDHKQIFKHSNVSKILTPEEFVELTGQGDYEKMIPLFVPDEGDEQNPEGPYRNMGSFSRYWDILRGNKPSAMSLYQVYFNLAGVKWKGQGPDIQYYPKSKSRRSRVGIGIANANLRRFVTDKVEFERLTPYFIPSKKNIYRRMNDINKSASIITDDHLTMTLAVYLRKYVYFLETLPLNLRLEFFGNGCVYQVPADILR